MLCKIKEMSDDVVVQARGRERGGDTGQAWKK